VKYYNLDYVYSNAHSDVDAKVKKFKKYFFTLFLKQMFLMLASINVFIVFANVNINSNSIHNLVGDFLPVDNNFGKLKYVSQVEDGYVHTAEVLGVIDFIYPFGSSYYNKDREVFISAGNNLVIAPCNASVCRIEKKILEAKIILQVSEQCVMHCMGNMIVGIAEGESIKQGDSIAFSYDGIITIELYINGKLVRNEQIF